MIACLIFVGTNKDARIPKKNWQLNCQQVALLATQSASEKSKQPFSAAACCLF